MDVALVSSTTGGIRSSSQSDLARSSTRVAMQSSPVTIYGSPSQTNVTRLVNRVTSLTRMFGIRGTHSVHLLKSEPK